MSDDDQSIDLDTLCSLTDWAQATPALPRASSQEIIDSLSQVEQRIQWIRNRIHQDCSHPETLIHLAAVQGALNQIVQLIDPA